MIACILINCLLFVIYLERCLFIRFFRHARAALNTSEYEKELISACSIKLDRIKSRKGLKEMDDFYVMRTEYFDWLFGGFIIITVISFITLLIEIFVYPHFKKQSLITTKDIRLQRRHHNYYYIFKKQNRIKNSIL